MINAIFYAIVFVFVGGLAVALLTPLFFPHLDQYAVGQVAGSIGGPILAVIGAIIGYLRSRRRR